jgi:hypothetical protein
MNPEARSMRRFRVAVRKIAGDSPARRRRLRVPALEDLEGRWLLAPLLNLPETSDGTDSKAAPGDFDPAGSRATFGALSTVPGGVTATQAGTTARFTGDASDDLLIVERSGGLLRHNRFAVGDRGYENDFDFDSGMPGVQTIDATASYTIDFAGADGDDMLTLDFVGGNPPPGTIDNYDGGTGADLLVLRGGAFTSKTDTGTGPDSGTITLDDTIVNFSNLEPVNETVPAINFPFTAPFGRAEHGQEGSPPSAPIRIVRAGRYGSGGRGGPALRHPTTSGAPPIAVAECLGERLFSDWREFAEWRDEIFWGELVD